MHPDSIDDADRVPHGGERDRGLLEFSANVNPRRPDGVRDAAERALDDADRYPDDAYPAFREAAAAYVDRATPEERAVSPEERAVSPDDVVPTPGGLAAIRLAFATHLAPGDRVLVPAPSFGEYAREVHLQGASAEFVRHDALVDVGTPRGPALDADDTDAADLDAYAMLVVCNPNNPTGDAYDADALRALVARCRDAGTLVLADEAFLGFTDEPSLAGEPGVVAARSLTKLFGLPGLRAGFAVATGRERDRLATARRAWNLGAPAAAVGAHCLRDHAFVDATRDRVATERARLVDELPPGVDAYCERSDRAGVAPFVLLDVGDRDPARVVEGCRERGVAIRDASTFRGLDDHVRVAVRERDANDELLAVLHEVCGE